MRAYGKANDEHYMVNKKDGKKKRKKPNATSN